MKQRNLSQDIAKGIAILLVVQAHTLQLTKGIGSAIGVLFGYAMPFFLFMTGYNYRNKGLSPWENVKKRIWQILRPFLVYSLVIFFVMGAYFLIRGEATITELVRSYAAFLLSKWGARMIGWNLPQVLFQRLLGPYWFLQFLMMASIVFYLCVDRAISSTKHLISWVALLSGISVVLIELNVVLPWGIQNAPAIASVMIIAAWFRKNDNFFTEPSKKCWVWINSFVCLLTIGLIQLKLSGAGYFGAGAMGEVCGGAEIYLFIVIAIMGTYFLINFCKLLEPIPVVSKALIWLGGHTLQILMLHLAVMHLIKDILHLPQTNAAEQLFVDKVEPGNILAYFLTIIVVVLIILLIEKVTALIKNQKKLKEA